MKNRLILSLLVIFALIGCKTDDLSSKIDEDTFWEKLQSAPFVVVPKEELPEWVNQIIEDLTISYVVNQPPGTFARIYRGKWDKRTVYYITDSLSSCALCFWDEKAQRIQLNTQKDYDKFYALSKNWELIFEVVNEPYQ